MKKLLMGLLLYNVIAILGSIAITRLMDGLENFDEKLPYYLLPGIFFASGGVIIGNMYNGKVHHGGIIGLIAWIAAGVIFLLVAVACLSLSPV